MADGQVSGLALAAVYEAVAVLFLVLAARMAQGRLSPNGFVGIRTSATMQSSEAWYTGHRAAAGEVRLDGLIMAGSGLVLGVAAVLGAPDGAITAIVLASSALVVIVLLKASVTAGRAIRDAG